MVSVIIPCRNEEDGIYDCLRSILAQESPPGSFEIVVADGMSDDGTRAILKQMEKEHSRLGFVDNPGRIVSKGLNAAIRVAKGKIIVRIDGHSTYAPDYLRQCVRVLQETGADNVGGPWLARGVGYVARAVAAAFQSPFAVGGSRCHNPGYEGPIDTVYLGCWRRDVFDRIGFFDEELVRNQDDEFNLRLRRAGGTIWQSPRIKSWYTPRASLVSLFKQYMQYGYWRVRVIKKHKTIPSWRHVIPLGLVLCLTILGLASLFFSNAVELWLVLAGVYMMSNVVATCLTSRFHGWELFPVLPLVFAVYHFAYGLGSLWGIWDFIILRRGPAPTLTRLTRDRTENHL